MCIPAQTLVSTEPTQSSVYWSSPGSTGTPNSQTGCFPKQGSLCWCPCSHLLTVHHSSPEQSGVGPCCNGHLHDGCCHWSFMVRLQPPAREASSLPMSLIAQGPPLWHPHSKSAVAASGFSHQRHWRDTLLRSPQPCMLREKQSEAQPANASQPSLWQVMFAYDQIPAG